MPANPFGTRKLRLFVGAGPTEFTSSVSDVRIVSGESESDFVSFADAAAGGAREYTLVMTLKQDNDSASLWYYAWASAGTDVAVQVWPMGQNTSSPTTPTAAFPKFHGTVTVTEPDGDFVGGEADPSNTAYFTTELSWKFTAKPTLAVA